MILIVTSKRDGHINTVAKHLTAAGASWARLNIEDFATNVALDVSPATGAGRLELKDSGISISLAEVRAVWYRKPDPIVLDHFEMEAGALDYVEAEFTEVIFGLYALLEGAYWINNPFGTRIAHRKMLQLKTAARVGFQVPRTLVTNVAKTALDFAAELNGDIAMKSLGAISVMRAEEQMTLQYGVFTRRITPSELYAFSEKIRHMPTMFQEFIEKDAELRVTCVGQQVFACRIQPRPGDVTSDDYRFDTPNLEHTAVDCPKLTARLHEYMRIFGLEFACFDFILTPTGEVVFLECNCNGQWHWIEERTGQPIAEAIANALVRASLATAAPYA